MLLDKVLDQIDHQVHLEGYQVVREYRGNEVFVEGDEAQLRQVFTNLIVNGLQAMPEGGVVEIGVTPDPVRQRVEVAVLDHGCGVQDEDMENLFTPFFSTKARGTGLGLDVSYCIVKDYGGVIVVKRLKTGGTILLSSLASGGRQSKYSFHTGADFEPEGCGMTDKSLKLSIAESDSWGGRWPHHGHVRKSTCDCSSYALLGGNGKNVRGRCPL